VTPTDVASALREEARHENERRLLVVHGDPEHTRATAASVLESLDVPLAETTVVGGPGIGRCEHLDAARAGELLGTTRSAVVVDAHEELRPNAVGAVVGSVEGGGLLLLLAPALAEWPDRRDAFDEGMAVPPATVDDVSGHFRERFVATLRAHRGVAVVAVDDAGATVADDGLTNPGPRLVDSRDGDEAGDPPGGATFPDDAYAACRTDDQRDALGALEALAGDEAAVVVEADRGRGKSSACGLAAGALAADGADVLVTAPEFRACEPAFERARELLATLDGSATDAARPLETAAGGRVRYAAPTDAVETLAGADAPDVLVVDEAAALSVGLLTETLAADRVAYATTVHGYEGAGRGFSVRFRDRLADAREVTEATLADPIRYAAGDPVETWAFRALALDARPPVPQLIEAARPDTVDYLAPDGADLFADEHLLREVFGLLVLAHYRTDPADLARLLDAPNLAVRVLTHGGEPSEARRAASERGSDAGHVVAVALLAREGGLPADRRARMYEGERVRGNMLPDVLTSQYRDEAAAEPVGRRVVRIATHGAVRSRGLGSHLLGRIREEFAAEVDWLGTGYGATPDLLSFWADNGYRTVGLSTTRNDASGEYSALMLSPTSAAGRDLAARHADLFARRVGGLCSDPLDDADPDVLRAALSTCDADLDPDLSDAEWRVVAGAAYGPGLVDVAPGAAREVVVAGLLDDDARAALSDRPARVLVRKCLQGWAWDDVAADLGYPSAGAAMRAVGDALATVCDAVGGPVAREVRERFVE
jgi:tRNA(Met) cytidine acetyltransferase